MRFCLHKSQKTKTKLVTTMKEMNPKAIYVLEFRDYDLKILLNSAMLFKF